MTRDSISDESRHARTFSGLGTRILSLSLSLPPSLSRGVKKSGEMFVRPALADHSQTEIAFARTRNVPTRLYQQGKVMMVVVDFRFRKFIDPSWPIMPSRWSFGIASYYSIETTTFQAFDIRHERIVTCELSFTNLYKRRATGVNCYI